ncbi:MAG TPA: aldehyde dehydrogenase family protein [Bryobacteraceae bacterium]|nr:aldehyde dehydrogenase family protein [Bryobacteraceae bacterium]
MSSILKDADLVSVQEARSKVEEAHAAWQRYRSFSQEKVDAIVEQIAAAARAHARRLAALAVEETGYGNVKDKLAKNLLCADVLPRAMRGMKTVGVVREISEQKIVEIAVPMGVVAAILPTTNPTSTAIYKTLISLKAGNAIVLSPHPRAKKCTCETAAVLEQAAFQAGAPQGLVGCIYNSTLEATNALMKHPKTSVILSTGGSGIVRAAYSSGKPAFGVGPGNVPVLLDTSANVDEAIAKVVEGKAFDFGTVCSSEQCIVAERALRDPILAALKARKAYLCDARQTEALARLLLTPNFTVNPDCVGQAAPKIARLAGFEAPADTSILVVEIQGVGKQHPLSAEKLSPVLSLYFVRDFGAALDACEALLRFGGLGHTAVIHASDDARIREFALRMPAFRVLANTAAPHGSTGITTNVFPAMTLGCGAVAGNSTSDNVGPLNLINIKRLAYMTRKAEEAFESPEIEASDAGGVDRHAVVAAVERYLAKRGLDQPPPMTAAVVDRFLTGKRGDPAASSASPPVSGREAPPAAEPVSIADFVCEDDVRQALKQSKKIYVGATSIVTPSARDLALQHDVLILTDQKKAMRKGATE